MEEENFDPDDEIANIYIERKKRHEEVFQNMVKTERRVAALDKQTDVLEAKFLELLSKAKN